MMNNRNRDEYAQNFTNKRGIVVERDPKKKRIKVNFEDEDETVSYWIDVLAIASGSTQSFAMPDLDDEVWCALDPKGEDGCLIGVKYNDKNTPPHERNEDIGLKWDGGFFHLDKGTGAVTLNTSGDVLIEAQGDVTIKGANIHLNP